MPVPGATLIYDLHLTLLQESQKMQKLLRNVNVTHFYILYVFFCPEYFILIISALKKLYVARIQFNNNFFPLITRKQGGNLNNFETYLAPTQPTLLLQPRAIYLDNCIIKVLA